jgi:hypothetical protein
MPKIERWENFPEGLRRHLIERMRDQAIGIGDLNQLRLWIETSPEVPLGDWYKDIGSFKICGRGSGGPLKASPCLVRFAFALVGSHSKS